MEMLKIYKFQQNVVLKDFWGYEFQIWPTDFEFGFNI